MTRERADAARNSELLLAAASRVFARREPGEVTMDELAREAGVGRATLYRRYPDVRSVAVALLGDRERALQSELMSGPPPLGPGAPPRERLVAFLHALAELLESSLPLLLAAEAGAGRFRAGAYGFWRAHVSALLRQAGIDDAGPRADLLLAVVEPELYRHLRSTLDLPSVQRHLAWLAELTIPEERS